MHHLSLKAVASYSSAAFLWVLNYCERIFVIMHDVIARSSRGCFTADKEGLVCLSTLWDEMAEFNKGPLDNTG